MTARIVWPRSRHTDATWRFSSKENWHSSATSSGRAVFYPRVAVPGTGGCGLAWEVSAGMGTVHAVTTVHYRGDAALNVSLIDMDEGFRLMSRIEGIPASEVRIGMRVRMRVHRPDEGQPYPVFDVDRPVSPSSREERQP